MIGNLLIFAAGLAVYAGYGLPGLACLLAAVLISYLAALWTEKFRAAAWIGIGVNAILLTFFKVQHLTGLQFAAPLGVSYFTLMLIAYNADVLKGKYPAERNLIRFAACLTYFPHLLMGPIESYGTLAPRLFENRRVSWDGISSGSARFLWGLFKKLVVAARAGVIVSAIAADPEQYRGGYALLAMILYSVQLYSDFSGGIDMVLGGSRILGITLRENFDAPFLSQSVREFWRRWHMTLGSWLREYIYIPLGGSRKGSVRKVINTLITFLVSGFWHGTEYLLWGLFNGIFVSVGERLAVKNKLVNRMGTFLAISSLWCFFVWPEDLTAVRMLLSVFTEFNYGQMIAGLASMGLTPANWLVLALGILVVLVYDGNRQRFLDAFGKASPALRVTVMCVLAFLTLVFGMYGIGFEASQFIYSRF